MSPASAQFAERRGSAVIRTDSAAAGMKHTRARSVIWNFHTNWRLSGRRALAKNVRSAMPRWDINTQTECARLAGIRVRIRHPERPLTMKNTLANRAAWKSRIHSLIPARRYPVKNVRFADDSLRIPGSASSMTSARDADTNMSIICIQATVRFAASAAIHVRMRM